MEENYMKKKELTPGQALARQIIEQYKPTNVADMQNALKEIFGPMFEAMLNGEMDNHLGYQNKIKKKLQIEEMAMVKKLYILLLVMLK